MVARSGAGATLRTLPESVIEPVSVSRALIGWPQPFRMAMAPFMSRYGDHCAGHINDARAVYAPL
ncbi:hypothetical protein J2D73_19450 [Acetobacter sacchari]|uniref:Uncharacterized protein n=1 Tax=Acetobacter sacchari TaxID=2661687 RepID=A0ABS3M199_9PROT|nr:hypothetical protein [Acetobacter sacchari]